MAPFITGTPVRQGLHAPMPMARGHSSLPIIKSSRSHGATPITSPRSFEYHSSFGFGAGGQVEYDGHSGPELPQPHESVTHIDITHLLPLPQKEAARRLGISESMLCKRFKESTPRKWPYRYVCTRSRERERERERERRIHRDTRVILTVHSNYSYAKSIRSSVPWRYTRTICQRNKRSLHDSTRNEKKYVGRRTSISVWPIIVDLQ